MSDLLKKNKWFAHSLIYHEQTEGISHSCSFVMSDLSDLLTVAHLTWAIRSQLLICPERSELIAHSRSFDLSNLSEWAMSKWGMSKWANSQSCLVLNFQIRHWFFFILKAQIYLKEKQFFCFCRFMCDWICSMKGEMAHYSVGQTILGTAWSNMAKQS